MCCRVLLYRCSALTYGLESEVGGGGGPLLHLLSSPLPVEQSRWCGSGPAAAACQDDGRASSPHAHPGSDYSAELGGRRLSLPLPDSARAELSASFSPSLPPSLSLSLSHFLSVLNITAEVAAFNIGHH